MPKPPAFAKVFHEVRPDVFSVDPEFWHLVDGRCWAWAATSLDADRLMAGSTHVAAMLDGGVIAREVIDSDAWDEDALDAFGDGIWVVGNQVVRLLAHLADLEQPARLEDEVEVPVVDELERAASARQVVLGDAESQTELLRSCFDASDWDALVLGLRRG